MGLSQRITKMDEQGAKNKCLFSNHSYVRAKDSNWASVRNESAPLINYEVRLRSCAPVGSTVLPIIENFLSSFACLPKSIIPSIDHAMIEEKENIEEEIWNFVRKNVAEIVICDESLENLRDSGAKLGKLHIFTL